MAQQAAITVFDGAATPVSHVLSPIDNKVLKDGTRYCLWREFSATLPVEACITLEEWQRTLPSGAVETRTRVSTPVMEAVGAQNAQGYTAAPKIAYVETDEHKKISARRSTGAIKNQNLQMLRNLLNNVSVTAPAVAAGVVYDSCVVQALPT